MLWLALRPRLKRLSCEFEGEGIDVFSHIEDISLCFMDATANAAGGSLLLWRELTYVGIVVNPAETVALQPKRYVPMVEHVSILTSVDGGIADKIGVTVVGVPTGTHKNTPWIEQWSQLRMETRTSLRAALLICRASKQWPSSPLNPSGREQAMQ